MKCKIITCFGLLFFLFAACEVKERPDTFLFISSSHPDLQYQGRIGNEAESLAKIFYWSGSSVKISFEGKEMSAVMKDEHHDNFFNVFVNGELTQILHPDTVKKSYLLADNLPDGIHTVELFKRTEWRHGKTWFYGFHPFPEAEVKQIPAKNRLIEFYGNSITAGYAVEDYSDADSPDSIYTNFYHSYAAVTARHFDANYSAIVKSGIGITVSWEPDIMPEIWDRLDPTDSLSAWNFAEHPKPDLLVINLLQNDSWLTMLSDYPEHKKRFPEGPPSVEFVTARYQDFVRNLRNKYPDAHIICMMGNMDITKEGSPWPKHLKQVVEALKDSHIYILTVPYKDTPGHPRIEEQKVMAQALINLIEKKLGW